MFVVPADLLAALTIIRTSSSSFGTFTRIVRLSLLHKQIEIVPVVLVNIQRELNLT